MFPQLQTASLCFVAINALVVIGSSQGTYVPPPTIHCCDNAVAINGRCVCKPNFYGDSTHKCVQPCYGKCGVNEECDLYKFTCSCKPRYVKINNKCQLPCGGDCIANAKCNNTTNRCECVRPFIGNADVRCYRPSTFALRRPTHVVSEKDNSVKIQVTRIAGVFGDYDVTLETKDITATVDKDYTEKTHVVKFGNLQTTAYVSIPIIDDTIDEPDETFEVTLKSVNNGGIIGNMKTTVVTIRDNDLPCEGKCKKNSYCHIPSQTCRCNRNYVFYKGVCEKPCFGRCCENALCHEKTFQCYCKPGYYGNPLKRCEKPSKFRLEKAGVTVNENVGGLVLKVIRLISSLGPAKVTWVANDGTAVHGYDFINHGGDLFFKDGETVKFISLPIVDDKLFEKTETFTVSLDDATDPDTIVSPSTATVTILDNDKPCHGLCKDHARCNEVNHKCVCEKGYFGNPYAECHLPCYGKCVTNAHCDEALNHCQCNKGLVGDGEKKCGPPCDNRCKNFPHSHCSAKTNKCVCDDTYYGNPYTSGCKCGTSSHY